MHTKTKKQLWRSFKELLRKNGCLREYRRYLRENVFFNSLHYWFNYTFFICGFDLCHAPIIFDVVPEHKQHKYYLIRNEWCKIAKKIIYNDSKI